MTVQEYVNLSVKELDSIYENEEALQIYKYLVCHYEGDKSSAYLLLKEKELTEELKIQLDQATKRLLKFEPFQYIIATENFYGYDFFVNQAVLIPRPETEELVEWIAQDNKGVSALQILDIGTGSGCIPIVLAKLLPTAHIQAIDVSLPALEVAKQNNTIHTTKVNFKQLDILDSKQWDFEVQFDIIVSNPPYIPHCEKKLMYANVLAYEPAIALFVENDTPLLFYEAIAEFALVYLKEGGHLYFECNEYNIQKVKNMLIDYNFANVEIKQDMQQKERMLKATKQ